MRGRIARSPTEPLLKNVLRPTAKLAVGSSARRAGLLSAAIDNSDGLYPSLAQLAEASDVTIVVEPSSWSFTDGVVAVAGELGIEPRRLALGWGDWQLVATCRPELVAELQLVADGCGCGLHVLGRVEAGDSQVDVCDGGKRGPLIRLDSQRFSPDSWFSAGLDAYIEAMLKLPFIMGNDVRPPG